MKRILIIAVAALALVYAGDYAALRIKMMEKNSSAAFGVVQMQTTYAIPHKDGRAELVFGDPVNQTCVHSLFPHFGDSPCWYLNRKNRQTTLMTILPPFSSIARLAGIANHAE